jgi:hypothetical protein
MPWVYVGTNACAEIAKGHVLYDYNSSSYLRYQFFKEGEHERLRWMLWNYVEEEVEEEDGDEAD